MTEWTNSSRGIFWGILLHFQSYDSRGFSESTLPALGYYNYCFFYAKVPEGLPEELRKIRLWSTRSQDLCTTLPLHFDSLYVAPLLSLPNPDLLSCLFKTVRSYDKNKKKY